MGDGYESLHPVFADRLRKLNEACGTSLVSGWRSSERQQELYDGYVMGLPGYNPANPPGCSNHEAVPWGDALGLAADIDGDLALANARAAEFGLHFPVASVEPWHCQPIEVPYAYFTGIPSSWDTPGRRPTLRAGALGPSVVELQQRLAAHGFSCAVDGDFGAQTEEQVKRCQEAKGLEVDGIVGATTWDTLDAEADVGADAGATSPQEAPVPVPATSTGRRAPAELRLSSQGAQLIAEFTGKRNRLTNDPAGNATIGIGHLVHDGPIDGRPEEAPFANGLSDQEVYDLFISTDVPNHEQPVRELISVPLFQSEFDALVSFTLNVGAAALGESTLRRLLNNGDYRGAADEFARWAMAGGQRLEGLALRREREAALFRSEWGAAAPPPPPGRDHPPWPGIYLREGDRGHDLTVWQRQMRSRGWSIDDDGVLGPRTSAVILKFQAEKGLDQDGTIGPATWDAAWTASTT